MLGDIANMLDSVRIPAFYNLKASPFRAGMAKAYKPCKNDMQEPGMIGSWGSSGPPTALQMTDVSG